MKVALVIERMDTARGGRETSTAQIAAELVRRGCDVTVLCQRGSLSGDGINVKPLGRRGLLRHRAIAAFVADVQREISSLGYDVVHSMLPVPGAHVYQPRGGTVPAQAEASIRRRDAVSAMVFRAVEPLNMMRRTLGSLERRVMDDLSTTCLAVSRMVGDEFLQHYGRNQNVRVVYNAVALPDISDQQRQQWRAKMRDALHVKDDDPVFVTLATNFELKGIAPLISAFARWYHRRTPRVNARLVIVGGEFTEAYERYAGGREIGNRVIFAPRTSEVLPYYAAADACVLLSWYDPCSRVVLEATRWGIPSITTRFNGAAEILQEGAGVVVSSPNSTAEVVDALEKLSQPANRAEMSLACRNLDQRLSIERHVDELMEVYKTVASAHPRDI